MLFVLPSHYGILFWFYQTFSR